MTDQTQDSAPVSPTELEILKDRATRMGLTFSNNIKVETLRARIEAKLNGEEEEDASTITGSGQEDDAIDAVVEAAAPKAPLSRKALEQQIREELHASQMKLVRLRITNLDPKKKDLPGEILTIANEYLGTVRKYVPFGEHTDNGYHVPYCIYQMMKERRFLNIRVTKSSKGEPVVSTGWAQEFALEELPMLTEDELARLAASQAAAGTFTGGIE